MNNRALRLHSPFAQPVRETAPAPVPDGPDGHRTWRSVTARIRNGDTAAVAEFHAGYSRGVLLLLRRSAGMLPAERLIEGVMRGAVEEIKRGWIRAPRDLLFFVRSVASRQIQSQTGELAASASEHFRIQEKARRLERALAGLLPSERDAMIRHYLDGCPMKQLARETGLDLAALRRLKAQLREEVFDILEATLPGRGLP
jgi:hypothetical protein